MSECCRNRSGQSSVDRQGQRGGWRRAWWLSFAFLALILAAPAMAVAADPPPPCVDGDGDGYVQCTASCDSTGQVCGDCDDGDSRIFRDAACALCDGPGCTANFCVPGSTARPCPATPANPNEATGFCLTISAHIVGTCSNNAAQGCFSNADCPGGTCNATSTPGFGLTCSDAGTGDACAAPPVSDQLIFAAEGGLGLSENDRRFAASCSDGQDNDCDGLDDLADPECQTAEFCDGRDNDGDGVVDDGFGVGNACSSGVGACAADGTRICNADGLGTVCNAVPLGPGVEGPFGSAKCTDGVDNDCDGRTDFPAFPGDPDFDPDCTKAEVCDGLDNDGDGQADNGFDVGAPCSAGQSACQVTGEKVCAANGLGTVCNAVPLLGSLEGPTAPASCSDGIDNDCDGVADGADASCGTIGLRATCALPFWTPDPGGRGSPGRDCNSTHEIVFDEPEGVQVTAELVALSPAGTVLGSVPVQNGQLAHLASRLGADDFQIVTETLTTGELRHKIFAPMPMLRVTAFDGVQKATAYCTTLPYLDVVKPSGGVVTLNQSATGDQPDVTPVLVALPRVQAATLIVKVDGVDVFAALGKSPTQCTVATPCSGDITIGSETVHVSSLVVDIAADLEDSASNSLSMNLENLGCGGHVVTVSGQKIPGSMPNHVTRQCLVDDLADKGTSFSFGIEITSPASQSTANPVPTPVAGKVCHGLPIESVTLNGREIFDPALLTVTPPPNEEAAATYEFPINVSVGQTNVARDVVFGDHPVGTFDPGSNFVQAAATDSQGNRTFNNKVVFATEQTAQPGVGALSAPITLALEPQVKAALENEVAARFRDAVQDVAMTTSTAVEVPNAFVVALDGDALTNFFTEKCTGPGEDGLTLTQRFQALAKQNLEGKLLKTIHPPFLCACDPPVPIRINTIALEGNITCPVLFPGQPDPDGEIVPDDAMRVVIGLPNIVASISGSGSCEDEFLGVCIASAYASVSLDARISNIRLKFDITETQLEGTTAPGDPQFHADAAAAIEASIQVASDVGCIGGDFCEGLVTIFTLGQLDLTPNITIDRTFDLAKEIGQAEPDPIMLKDIKLDEEEIANFNQTVRGDLVDVNISSHGLRASLTGRFSTNFVDPEVVANPGMFLQSPPTPELPLPDSLGDADDGAVLVNADSINMLFAGLTLSGRLKSECNVSLDPNTGDPRTLGSLLPADCNSINAPNDGATALGRGFCHGLREADCETLLGPGFLTTPVEQGACHGLQGASCNSIAAGFLGTLLPADCNAITVGGGDVTDPDGDPSRMTLIAQGRCAGLKGADCETLTAPTADETAIKQGACHGQKVPAADCTTLTTVFGSAAQEIGTCAAVRDLPCTGLGLAANLQCGVSKIQRNILEAVLRELEQGACGLAPSLNVNANQPLLFCARQDLPAQFLIRDDSNTDPVEVGLRLNDLSLAVMVDRNGNQQLDGQLTATPRCFGEGAVPSGDCSLAALCLDLNFVASFELAGSECPSDGGTAKPGFKARILDVQTLQRVFGQVCSGLPAGDDGTVVSQSTSDNASIETLRLNAESFSPPACVQGLTLGNFVTFEDPTVFALRTGAPKSVCATDPSTTCTSNAECGGGDCVAIQNYIGISTKIVP